MILRGDGDSHLVNVEYKSELQWCKSLMLRDLTGLVTHEHSGWAGHSATADADEESDVAGYSAAAIVDERRVASSTIELPSCELWSRTRRLKFLLFHFVVHVSLEGAEKLHNLFTFVVQCRSL